MSAATLTRIPTRATRKWVKVLTGIGTRILSAVAVLLSAATLVFLAQTLLPGDRATIILNINSGQVMERTPEELAPINEEFGFDNPLIVQYLDYIGGLLRGDLGISFQQFSPVTQVIGEQLLPSVQLAFGALLLSWIIMIVSVLLSAGRPRLLREISSAFEALSASLPVYWLGVLLLVVFAVQLQWFPVMGGANLASAILPIVTLSIPLAGFMAQTCRDEFERILRQPFATAVRMRGVSDLSLRLKHVLRHALIPPITLSGWAIGALFSGTVIIESVFSRPGVGQVLVNAVGARDVPVVAGVVMLIALIYVVANVVVDIFYALVDPRRRAS